MGVKAPSVRIPFSPQVNCSCTYIGVIISEMSMNLYLRAKIKVNGKERDILVTENFSLPQTRTEDTRRVLSSSDPRLEYEKVIEESSNIYTEHKSSYTFRLDRWLKDHEGWKIEWYTV